MPAWARRASLPTPPTRSLWLPRIGFAAVVLFVASLLVLHMVDLPEDPAHMSGYARTSMAPLWFVASSAFALGAMALTMELRRRLVRHPFRRTGITLLWLSTAGAVILAAFPVDADPANRTLVGLIHEDAAPPTFLLAAAAMIVLAPAFHSAQGWRRLAGLSLVCGFLSMAFALAYVFATLAEDPTAGIVQRLLVGSIVLWMLLVAGRLLRPNRSLAAPDRESSRPTCAL